MTAHLSSDGGNSGNQRGAHFGDHPGPGRGGDAEDEALAWWSSIRPIAPGARAATAAIPAVLVPAATLPAVAQPDARRGIAPGPHLRTRRRAHTGEVGATTHVLRVRALLTPDEQRRFDELMRGASATELIAAIVSRGEAEALESLRGRLEREPGAAELAKREIERQLAAMGPLLTIRERCEAHASLTTLWPEELEALAGRLLALQPAEAAVLLRTYLAAV